jgi:hypothetical protein
VSLATADFDNCAFVEICPSEEEVILAICSGDEIEVQETRVTLTRRKLGTVAYVLARRLLGPQP